MKIESFSIKDYMMGNGLKLQGCELLLFAIIHSFSSRKTGMFCSERYLAGLLGYRRECVSRALTRLLEKNLIMRSAKKHTPGNTYCYYVNEQEVGGIINTAFSNSDQDAIKHHISRSKKVSRIGDEKSHKINEDIKNNDSLKKGLYGKPSNHRGPDYLDPQETGATFHGSPRL